MKSSVLLSCALAALAGVAFAQDEGGPLGQAAPKRYKDTAGTYLSQVVAAARQRYADAELISITGRTDITGSSICSAKDPAADGWHYHFYSKSYNEYAFIAQCEGYVVGPMKEMLSGRRDVRPILGRFADNDEALKHVSSSGVSIDPAFYGARGRRPFSFSLVSVEDERYKDATLFWQIKLGREMWLVNGTTNKVEKDVVIRYERTADGGIIKPGDEAAGGAGANAIFKAPARQKKAKGYTALADVEKVRAFVRKKMPGGVIMGVDGIADAWGNCECDGPGDGWAYYIYWPRSKGIEVVYSCKGQVHEGQSAFIPVSLGSHKDLPRPKAGIDSDKAMDGLLADKVAVMNEGMGRYYSRRVPMRLFNYRTSPFTSPALWKKTLVWEVSIGRSTYLVDAVTGQYLAEKPKQ